MIYYKKLKTKIKNKKKKNKIIIIIIIISWGAGINESTHKFGIFPLICCSDNISGNFDDHNKRYSNPVRSRSRLNSRTRSPVNSYTGI